MGLLYVYIAKLLDIRLCSVVGSDDLGTILEPGMKESQECNICNPHSELIRQNFAINSIQSNSNFSYYFLECGVNCQLANNIKNTT
jgi:hypothetical protein